MRGAQRGAAESDVEAERIILEDLDRLGSAIADHSDLILHEEKASSLRNVSGRVVQTQVRVEAWFGDLGKNLAMVIIMEAVGHDTIIASELEDLFNNSIAEALEVAARQGLETGNSFGSKFVGLKSSGSSHGEFSGLDRLKVDNETESDTVEDGVERSAGGTGMDKNRVKDGDIGTRGGEGSLVESSRARGSEEGANITTKSEHLRLVRLVALVDVEVKRWYSSIRETGKHVGCIGTEGEHT